MPRPALTAEQKQEIRKKIRAAASRVYEDGGPGSVSARRVATEAGVSVGTLYSHFGSLSELYQSLWRKPVRQLLAQMEQQASETECPRTRLQTLLRAYVDFSAANASVFRSAFLFVRPEKIAAPTQVALADDRFFQLYRSAISAGQDAGLFRAGDLDQLTQTVLSAVHGSLALPINLHRLALDATQNVPELMIAAMLEWLEKS
ncbi:MAG: TetR/AcrR family transcriptional regulator [Pseudomonadota bacterium]